MSPLLSPVALAPLVERAAVVIVDCRFSLADPQAGWRAYAAGHIPGAVYAHLDDDLAAPVVAGKTGRHPWPAPEAMAARLEEWGIGNDTRVAAYDDAGGAIASRLWFLLRWLGHDGAQVLDGGYGAWVDAGLAVSTAVPEPARARFTPHLRAELIVDAAGVDHVRLNPDYRLFDARGPARFRGEQEPIDKVAGHIPGARSLPFEDNLEGGRLRSAEALRARFDLALDGVAPERAVVYCGSGVTACHDILAAAHAGLDGLRLYPGSWSEWITDPARPLARDRSRTESND